MTSIEVANNHVNLENDRIDHVEQLILAEKWVNDSSVGMLEHLKAVAAGKELKFTAYFMMTESLHAELYRRLQESFIIEADVNSSLLKNLKIREIPTYSEEDKILDISLEASYRGESNIHDLGRLASLY